MRVQPIVLLACLAAAPALAATRVPRYSWGKPGVSFDQYRLDAARCTADGYFRDISGTDAAKAFVRGSRELDDATQSGFSGDPYDYANQLERIKMSVQPDRQMHAIALLQQKTVDACLVAHGYRRFHLSEEQRHALGKLAVGSAGRRAYLHRLASDPAVLVAQAQWYVGAPPR